MPRKEMDFTIDDPESRDSGKTFHIMEMPAIQADRWGTKAVLAAARSGVEIPANLEAGGLQAIAVLGIQALMRVAFEDAQPLLDEMMTCVTIAPAAAAGLPEVRRRLIESDIEEVKTIWLLRSEVLSLHVGFSIADSLSKWTSAKLMTPTSSDTQTSQG